MKVAYFDFNGIPAYIEYKKFPVKIVNGQKVIEYDLVKFFTYAQSIPKAKFDKLVGEK